MYEDYICDFEYCDLNFINSYFSTIKGEVLFQSTNIEGATLYIHLYQCLG